MRDLKKLTSRRTSVKKQIAAISKFFDTKDRTPTQADVKLQTLDKLCREFNEIQSKIEDSRYSNENNTAPEKIEEEETLIRDEVDGYYDNIPAKIKSITLKTNQNQDSAKDELIKKLQDELAQTKAKEPLYQDSVDQQEKVAHKKQRVNLPKFNNEQPLLWWKQVETTLQLSGINDDNEKFSQVLVNLEGNVLMMVADLANNPPITNKFETLKNRILQSFAESTEEKLRRVFRGVDTAGKKPSEILANIKNLAAGECNSTSMKTLFLERLPEQIRLLLTFSGQENLDCLAQIADQAYSLSHSPSTVYSMSAQPLAQQQHQPQDDSSIQAISPNTSATINDLCKQIKELTN